MAWDGDDDDPFLEEVMLSGCRLSTTSLDEEWAPLLKKVVLDMALNCNCFTVQEGYKLEEESRQRNNKNQLEFFKMFSEAISFYSCSLAFFPVISGDIDVAI